MAENGGAVVGVEVLDTSRVIGYAGSQTTWEVAAMLKLNNATENWRELLCDAIATAERDHGIEAVDGCAYDDRANELRSLVLADLAEYKPVYQQSVGAFVIVQDGTPEERDVFREAVDKHLPVVARGLMEDVAATAVEVFHVHSST